MSFLRPSFLLAAAALTIAATVAETRAAPGDEQYVTIVSHDPSMFLKALRAGGDFAKGGHGRKFRIILASAGAIVAIPGTSTVQRDYMKSRRPGVEIIACRETIDALSQANRRRVPVLPGISVQKCQGLRNKMSVSGWQTAPGF
ncbi:hypothetical protein [Methylopila sp. M107]|uniref:hypothetical protein n=1 Tax=Methylopila sp. M107 TaxID=1101190 RepID=UPI00036C9108|nr:hypothetical protein [Methylopila sp. M107]